jgi:hypothetical protein
MTKALKRVGVLHRYFWASAAFAMPAVYKFLEAKRIKYAIWLPANQVRRHGIG